MTSLPGIMALKTVLITGCSAGSIGSVLAEAFQKRNLRVFATARDASKMSHLEKLSNVTLITLDPTSGPSVNGAVESVKAQTSGTLDYLVKNAGQTIIMPTLDFDIEIAKSMYDISIWGMMRVTQEFVPLVTTAKDTLVNVCSISTSVNTPWMGESSENILSLRPLLNIRQVFKPFESSHDGDHGHTSSRISALQFQGCDNPHWSCQYKHSFHRYQL